MSNSINLAIKRQTNTKQFRRLTFAAIATVCVSLLIALILLIISFTQSNTLNSLSTQKDQLEASINSQNNLENSLLLMHDRLSNAQKVISSRSKIPSQMNVILGQIPSSLQITSITTNKNDITLVIDSNTLGIFDSFLDNKIFTMAKNKNNAISKMQLVSFSSDPKSGEYELTMDFTVNP